MNDWDADAENTVGRSSSMNLSARSLYNLYTLAIQEICKKGWEKWLINWNSLKKKFNKFFNVQLSLIKRYLFGETWSALIEEIQVFQSENKPN
jgi:hypothetical protein